MTTEARSELSPFDPAAIDAETAEFNAKLEALMATVTPTYLRQPQEVRDEREAGGGTFGPIITSEMAQERMVAGVPCRLFLPETVRGVYLHIHGGGWVLGRAHHSDVRNEHIAQGCGLAVLSVDYRLAPEHPYPASQDDCEAVAAWLAEHTKAEFGTEKLLIGGESAGGHLAAATLLRMRDRHDYRGFLAANLVYGVYDLAMTPSQARWGERHLVLSTPTMAWFYDHFVPDASKRRDPDVSPLYADLRDLPPALFTVGTLDPLLDDTLFMYQRWLAAGNRAELAVHAGGVHGFNGMPSGLGRTANRRIDAFLKQAVEA
ncbi:MAG TPA: alpha/beta hydrolase [Dehalococcoidia bacterium]